MLQSDWSKIPTNDKSATIIVSNATNSKIFNPILIMAIIEKNKCTYIINLTIHKVKQLYLIPAITGGFFSSEATL